MKKKRKKPSPKRIGFWVVVLILIILIYSGWKIYLYLYNITPQFYYLLVTKNGIPLKIVNGETVQLHPADHFKIEDVSTNIFLNYGIRLVSEHIDINAFRYEEMQILKAMYKDNTLTRCESRVVVKFRTREIGYIMIIVEPYTEDWLDKVERTIGNERKIDVLKKAMEFAPNDKRIKDRLITEYKNAEKWDEAARLLEEKARETNNAETYYELLALYEKIHSTKNIIITLKKIIELKPDDKDPYLRLAMIFEESNRLEEAITAYEGYLERSSSDEQLSLLKTLGFLCSESGNLEKAVSYYLRAVEMDKEDVNLYYNLSTLYEKLGQKDKSDTYLMKALEYRTDDVQGRLKLAESLITRKNLKQAEKYLNDVLSIVPKSMNALLLLLKIAEEQGDREKQEEIYRKILSLDPNNKTVIYNLGILEYETGNPEKALPHFERLSKSEPKDKDLHILLFDIYRTLHKEDQAYREAQSIISLGVNDLVYYHFMIEYLDGKGNYDELINVLNQGIKIYPEDIDLHEYLVVTYLNKGQEDLAIAQLKKIAGLKPRDIPVLLRLGELLEKQNRLEEAIKIYKSILDINPDHKEAKEAYLRTLMKLGEHLVQEEKYKEAAEVYKTIIHISPGNSEAEEVYLKLRFKVLPDED